MNTVISSKDAREQFAEILNQVAYAGREFVIKRFDRPVAKIIPIASDSGAAKETARRKRVVARIKEMRKIYKGIDLTKIVIRERDKEYKRWKR